MCSSGLNSISLAANNIRVCKSDVIVSGGLEHMSAIPFFSTVRNRNKWLKEDEPGAYMPMGLTAENVAEKYKVSRKDQDKSSIESHKKVASAIQTGKFKDEIIALDGLDKGGNKITVYDDQGVRPI
jgi:acetyl-coA C-acyltransferase fadA